VSGVRLELTVNDGGLGQALQKAIALGEDMRPVLEASGQLIETNVSLRFDTSRGPGGIPWPPTWQQRHESVPTKKSKQVGPQRPSSKILIQSGSLRESITHAVGKDQVEIGVGANSPGDVDKYAAVQQFGATIYPRTSNVLVFTGADGGLVFATHVTIPARPFIGFDDQDVADLEDLWTDVVREAFDGN
jgi:phage gpG-like protein